MSRYLSICIYAIVLFFVAGCSLTKKTQSGESAFELKQYAEAIPLLTKEYNSTNSQKELARHAYQLGLSYQKTNSVQEAIPWFKKAVGHNYGREAIRELAFAYKEIEDYEQAIATFEKWEKAGAQIMEVRRELTICRQAMDWQKERKTSAYEVELLQESTPFADYAPVLFNRDYVVFTSDRAGTEGSDIFKWTNNEFSDLFIVQKNGGNAIQFDQVINTEHNEAAACFNRDFNEIFFTRCFSNGSEDAYCKILWSQSLGGQWSEPITPFYMEPTVNYGHPTLVEQDSVLIFSSNHPDGKGGYDLYYSVREENGWSSPELMPDRLNTEGNEVFPRADADTLYFSSDYLPGLGGLDIFSSYLRSGGQWTAPKNLRAPINSGGDDFSFVVDYNARNIDSIEKIGYFSSSRNGVGNDDLYKFQKRKIIEEIVEEEISEPETEEKTPIRLYLAGKVVEKQFTNDDDPNSGVVGKIPLNGAKVEIRGFEDPLEIITDQRGLFILELEYETDYFFRASKSGYLNNELDFTTIGEDIDNSKEDITYNVEIILDKIFEGKEIVMENIYYDFDEWFIREDAKPALDTLAKILNDNPGIDIQLSSHTDCRGFDAYNMDLSQKRAQSAVDYLISTGISTERLTAQGYGESRLEVNCDCLTCTEDQHQRNRRTTFKIIGLPNR